MEILGIAEYPLPSSADYFASMGIRIIDRSLVGFDGPRFWYLGTARAVILADNDDAEVV